MPEHLSSLPQFALVRGIFLPHRRRGLVRKMKRLIGAPLVLKVGWHWDAAPYYGQAALVEPLQSQAHKQLPAVVLYLPECDLAIDTVQAASVGLERAPDGTRWIAGQRVPWFARVGSSGW